MTSSRPYQSQVFRFLQKQSRRLSEGCNLTWRRFSLGVTWSAQIVLYPVYTLFQSTRVVGRQLEETIEEEAPKLPWFKTLFRRQSKTRLDSPPSAEAPILSILGSIQQAIAASHEQKTLAAGEDTTAANLVSSPENELYLAEFIASIQGIAAQVDGRSLVLVGADNTVLDVLPDLYQQDLRRQITRLVADYWVQHRQSKKRLRSQGSVLPLPASTPQALLSVQLFRQIMGWVQTGPIAVSANLFREADLVNSLTPQDRLPSLSFPKLPDAVYKAHPEDFRGAVFGAMRLMATQFSGVVAAPLALPSYPPIRPAKSESLGEGSLGSAIAQSIPDAIQHLPANIFSAVQVLSNQFAAAVSPAPLALLKSTPDQAADSEKLEQNPTLKPLIEKAIPQAVQNLPAQMFSALKVISSQVSAAVSPAPLAVIPQPPGQDIVTETQSSRHTLTPSIANAIPKPVQNLSTTVFSAVRFISSQIASIVPGALTRSNPTPISTNQDRESIQDNLDNPSPRQSNRTDKTSTWPTHLADKLRQLGQNAAGASESIELQPQLHIVNIDLQSALENQSPDRSAASAQAATIGREDWIDAQATFVEYIEHPLEKLLRWLDQAMLIAEGWILKLLKLGEHLRRP
ncbi:MAG: hypothetical protein QNJ46_08805 [Leptolyngbyaceae cyanobacterium MO_188.B28]|nr:hypothetical protein [Leptolyngbyaceae cyanobacterium MO_188.B28]